MAEKGLKPTSPIRRFYILRHQDISGIAGTGRIVEGVIFPNGRIYLQWRGPVASFVEFDDFAQFAHVYLHEGHGCNSVVWVDEKSA